MQQMPAVWADSIAEVWEQDAHARQLAGQLLDATAETLISLA